MSGTQVSGHTRLCFILADPVAHVRTPAAINALAARRGVDAIMTPLQVAAGDLPRAMAMLRRVGNLAGMVVTAPHKSAAAGLCDELSPRATQAGAVNVIRRLTDGRLSGDALDGLGFVRGLEAASIPVAGRRVFLAGAGGAASAIAYALVEAGAAVLAIHNRTVAKAAAIVEDIGILFPETEAFVCGPRPVDFDLAINATSAGLAAGDPLPFAVDGLAAGAVVAEVIMQPAETALMRAAAAHGLRTHPGGAMLDAQLELIADFLGLDAATAPSIASIP